MALPPLPDPSLLRQLLDYDAGTGRLFWRHRPRELFTRHREFVRWNNRYAGREALTFITKQGYRRGIVWYRHLLAHVVIFAWLNGRWPAGDVDHADGDRLNNRPDNLEEKSRLLNNRNFKTYRNNTSGRAGVRQVGNRWRARIGGSGVKDLGRFDTFEEACAAREAAERELDYHTNHGRQS